jgi:hypothetical protein
MEGRAIMRHVVWASLVGAAMLMASASPARAQVVVSNPAGAGGISPYFAAPGNYATSWGVPSFGWPRTNTVFSSPYGQGYGYGYYPTTYWPGYTGYQLWRPGAAVPGYLYGGSYYQNMASPHGSFTGGFFEPFNYYAPGFGPSAWYAY